MLKDIQKQYNKLCAPSQFYVVLSLISIAVILIQNLANPSKYCIGVYGCDLNFHNMVIFALKLVYVAFWAYVLDWICRLGYDRISWFLVLLPFVGLFIMLGAFILYFGVALTRGVAHYGGERKHE